MEEEKGEEEFTAKPVKKRVRVSFFSDSSVPEIIDRIVPEPKKKRGRPAKSEPKKIPDDREPPVQVCPLMQFNLL